MARGTETVLTRAASNSESLRTTVPLWIVEQFGLEDGDSIVWHLETSEKGVKLVVEPCKGLEKSKK